MSEHRMRRGVTKAKPDQTKVGLLPLELRSNPPAKFICSCGARFTAHEISCGCPSDPFKRPNVHFVGFRGEEFHSAVKVWGQPDFIHRWIDDRLWNGGELDTTDVVVLSKTARRASHPHSFNDSEVF